MPEATINLLQVGKCHTRFIVFKYIRGRVLSRARSLINPPECIKLKIEIELAQSFK